MPRSEAHTNDITEENKRVHLLQHRVSLATHVPEFNFFVSATSDDGGSEGGGRRRVGDDCICDSIMSLFDARYK